MMDRLRAVLVLVVILAAGVLVGSAVTQWNGWNDTASEGTGSILPRPRERVRVEVLNGGGRSGAARDATATLRDLGFDVVFYGNAASFGRDTSVVLDRVGQVAKARSVADALGVRNVRSEPDSNLYLDVSVVLGADWALPSADSTGVDPEKKRPWWDVRGWFR